MAIRARWIGVLGGVMMLALASGARAQVFYSFPGAQPVIDTSVALGLVSGFGDNVVRLGGFGRFNLTPDADLGFEAMFQNVDTEDSADDTSFYGAGADGKYVLLSRDGTTPVDLAVNAGVGFLTRDDYVNIHVPLGGIVSRDFTMNDGRLIVPYGGVYLLYDYVKIEGPEGSDDSDSDADVELRVGASAEIVRNGSLFAALHAGNGTMFFLGFNAGL
jgi:hypothetical protein